MSFLSWQFSPSDAHGIQENVGRAGDRKTTIDTKLYARDAQQCDTFVRRLSSQEAKEHKTSEAQKEEQNKSELCCSFPQLWWLNVNLF